MNEDPTEMLRMKPDGTIVSINYIAIARHLLANLQKPGVPGVFLQREIVVALIPLLESQVAADYEEARKKLMPKR